MTTFALSPARHNSTNNQSLYITDRGLPQQLVVQAPNGQRKLVGFDQSPRMVGTFLNPAASEQ